MKRLCKALEDGKQREKIVVDSVMKFHFRRPNFTEELNTQNIVVFEDGVYNFDTHEFGPGSPELAVTMRVLQKYVPYDPDHESTRLLMTFMSDILPDIEVRGRCYRDDFPAKVTAKFFAVDMCVFEVQTMPL